ncbi:MAG: magnesium transporter [Pirellulales bacterium]
MINPILLPELRLMLAEGDEDGLKNFVTELHPASVAEFSEGLDVEETWRVLGYAPLAMQADIFSYYAHPKQDEMVHGSGRKRMSALIEEMAPDDRIDLLKRIDENVVEEILPLLAKAERQDVRTLLSYPDSSAGAVMTTEYASVPDDITAGEAISRLRLQAPDNEMIYYIYVLGRDRHLLGFVSLKTLILARPNTLVADIMESDVVSVNVADDQEEVAKKMARYDMLAIPVVDDNGRLVGIVTHDDVIDVIEEEATEDAHRMGGVAPIEGNYLETPFASIWIKRSVWLSFLFVAEMITFTAMAHYEHALSKVLVLSLFIPLVIATGGNSGASRHADLPRDVFGANHARVVVEGSETRILDGPGPRRDVGRDRLFPFDAGQRLAAGRRRGALGFGAGHLAGGGRDLSVGHDRRLDAAADLPTPGLRPRLRQQPVRGDVRRRDGDHDLFQYRVCVFGSAAVANVVHILQLRRSIEGSCGQHATWLKPIPVRPS